MAHRFCPRRRRPCPECGSRSVFVRYEEAARAATTIVLQAPVQVRCTNRDCVKYWR